MTSASHAVPAPQDTPVLRKPLLLPPATGLGLLDYGPRAGAQADGFKVPVAEPPISVTPNPSAPNQSHLGLSHLQPPRAFKGDGYTPDSTAQTDPRNKKFALPGISLKVPLY